MIKMWLYVLIVTVISTDAARILGYFPTPSLSHQVVFRPLTQELAKRGHEVIVVTTDPAFPKGQTPPNLTEIDVHDISYAVWRKHFLTTTTGKNDDTVTQMTAIMTVIQAIHEQQLFNDEVNALIKSKNNTFDLVLLEQCFRPAWVLTHIFKAPTVFVSSLGAVFGMYEAFGAPGHPLLYPINTRQKLYNLSPFEKISEFYNHYFFENLFDSFIEHNDKLNRKIFGPDTPSVRDCAKDIDMMLVNVHPIWEDNRPVPPNVVFMGGIHEKPEKPLPKELKTYLDSSKNGVIYISFGTNVMPSMLPPERIQILVKVFSKLPYDVLWKYDKDELPGRSKNIRLEKWLPQSDLLRHPKVKMFITQGGLQSTDEAITAGVPLIGVPMLGDQWYNVDHYVHHKIGLRLDMETLTEETFMDAVKTILNDDSYRKNIIRLREIMHDQPQKPLERAVWWAEHVIRHKGAKHLKSSAANLTWAEYYEIELISILLVALLSIVLVISSIIYFIWKYVSKNFITTVKFKKL
ncbi:UDP-glucuronosyltransferase 2B4 isoform X4 [Manduca sexta]|uniref:UDP-glucuronosyltransferase 2B4 isoform X4 n=1 Tax=Manduca sexta TaxID=7130 RepID=UPI00188F6445|nr:UDP-glucuronosyltransferase 2B4 isoform X4 [Manduca sexta]